MAIQIIIIILGLLTIGGGLYETNHIWLDHSQNQRIVQKTADTWSSFADGLNDYVQQNESKIKSSTTVSCQTLQSDDYYGGSCTDPVGQNLEGVISAPYGFPQSWGVIATSEPDSSLLSQYGMGNTLIEQSLKWHSFLYNVATVLQGDNLHAYVYNGSSQTFKQPFGDSNVNSSYANYSLPVNPTTYGQSVDGVGPNGLMAFPQLHKEPGYWLWQVDLLSKQSFGGSSQTSGDANISFVNYGYSAVCPPGGLTPLAFGTSSTPWVMNEGSGEATYFSWGFEGNSSNAMFDSQMDPSYGFNYEQNFVCIPAPESEVNNDPSYDPFYTANDNVHQNIVNPNYNGTFWNGDERGTLQAGELYDITIGGESYALIAYAGNAGGVAPGNGYTPDVDEMAFYLGNPQATNLVSPSFFGGSQYNNQNGFYEPPVVGVPVQQVPLS